MKALIHLFRFQFSLCLVYMFLSGYALAAAPVGRVAVLVGEATAVSADEAVRKLKNKAPIYQNDAIRTQPDSQLQLFFNDKSIVTIGPDSELVIDEYVFDPKNSKGAFFTKSAKGVFRMVTGWISANHPDKVKITTPLGTIGFRGCYVAGAIDAKKKSLRLLYLGGLRGAERGVYVTNEFGMTILSRAGFGLEIAAFGMAPSSPMRFNLQKTRNLLAPTAIRALGGKERQPTPGGVPESGEKPAAKPGEKPKPGVAPEGAPKPQSDQPGWNRQSGGQPGEPDLKPKTGSQPASPPPVKESGWKPQTGGQSAGPPLIQEPGLQPKTGGYPASPSPVKKSGWDQKPGSAIKPPALQPPKPEPPKFKPPIPKPPIRPEPPKPKPPQTQAPQTARPQVPSPQIPQAPPLQTPQAPPPQTPQAPPPQTPQAPPLQTPQAPPPQTPQAPPLQTPQAPPPQTPQAPPPQTPQAPPPQTPQAPPPQTPQAPPPQIPQAPPPLE